MNKNDVEGFNQVLISAAEVTGKSLSAQSLVLYWDLLSTFELTDIRNAVQAHLKNPETGSFMPKPADIIKFINGSSESRSMQAWTKVDKAIRTVGIHESIAFDDPLIHAVIESMGGWITLNNIQNHKEIAFKAVEFEKRYRGFLITPPGNNYPSYLIGSTEMGNSQRGYKTPVYLFGQPDRAKYVKNHGRKLEVISNNPDPVKKIAQQLAKTIAETTLSAN